MKKLIALLLAAGMLLGLLAGCQRTEKEPHGSETVSSRPINFYLTDDGKDFYYTDTIPFSGIYYIMAKPMKGGESRILYTYETKYHDCAWREGPTVLCCWEDRVIFTLDGRDMSRLCWVTKDGSENGIYIEELRSGMTPESYDFYWIPEMAEGNNWGFSCGDIIGLNQGIFNLRTGEIGELKLQDPIDTCLIGQIGQDFYALKVDYNEEKGDNIKYEICRVSPKGALMPICSLKLFLEDEIEDGYEAPFMPMIRNGFIYAEDLKTIWKIDPTTGEKEKLCASPEIRRSGKVGVALTDRFLYTIREDGLHRISLSSGRETVCGIPSGADPEYMREPISAGDGCVFRCDGYYLYDPKAGFREVPEETPPEQPEPAMPEESTAAAEEADEEKIRAELTGYSWLYDYRSLFIYEFDEDGTYHAYAYRNNTGETDGMYYREDTWTPLAANKDITSDMHGTWSLEGNHIHMRSDKDGAEVTAELFFRGTEGYDTWNSRGYTGNSIIYETSYEEPAGEYAGPSAAFSLCRLAEREEPDLTENRWRGVYFYDNSDFGELFIITASDSASVAGQYIFQTAIGDYGIRDFQWEIISADGTIAREPFQNGEYTYYRLGQNEVTAEYPDGWWPDRQYVYKCTPEEVAEVVQHPMLGNADAVRQTW